MEELTDEIIYDIVPTYLVVQAMRDNGYKNAAYAIAELIDNSIQAEATMVELLCAEEEETLTHRTRKRLKQIAVLDNGVGMNAEVLRQALQFGNGTRLETGKSVGIGRFGMGLPASSISQCKRVDVWTWQNGAANAINSYLDIDEIKNRSLSAVPQPKASEIPEIWKSVASGFGEHGTLVVWSSIDRCMWKSASAVLQNSEFLIGRMYRRFLDNDSVKIRLVAFNTNSAQLSLTEKFAVPNDPGYLMTRTSCPPPYDNCPLFEQYPKDYYEKKITVQFRDKTHEVTVRFSLAKVEARRTDQAGNTPYGRHAGKNVGVSLVRAGRELDLDQALVIQYDPRERWWGVEIDFPPSLDELFGVTNNKQSAHNFSSIATLNDDLLLMNGRTSAEVKAELEADGDPAAVLWDITHPVKNNLQVMRGLIKAQTKGTRPSAARHTVTPEETATARTKDRQDKGFRGASDTGEQMPEEDRKQVIHDELVEQGVPEATADELTSQTVDSGFKYVFATADLETAAFFSVRLKGGAIIITLNTSHSAYDNLVDILEENVDGVDATELRERLTKALNGLKLLLTAWARYEDELPDVRRHDAMNIRNDWGRVAQQFLDDAS